MKKLHPAYFIKQDLDEMELSPAEFAKRSGISEKQVSDLLNEKIGVTLALAEKLSAFFGSSISLWIGLQTDFDSYSKSLEKEQEEKDDYTLLLSVERSFRLRYLVDKNTIDKRQMVLEARKNLQVGRLEYLKRPDLYRAYKETRNHSGLDFLKNVWLSIADKAAREEDSLVFNEKVLIEKIPVIRSLSEKTPVSFYPLLRKELQDCGIHFVFVPYLAKSNIYGATKWMDEGQAPLIALSNRGHSSDVFWFTLFHEISHVLMGHKKNTLVSTSENDDCDIERQADKKAATLLIHNEEWDSFVKKGVFNKASISSFAHEAGVGPGIVVGRLQKEGRLDESYCNDLKDHYEAKDFLEFDQ